MPWLLCATINIVQISFQAIFFPLDIYPEVELQDHMVVLFFPWGASAFLQQLDVPISTQDKYIHLDMCVLQKQIFKKRVCLTRLRFLSTRTISFMFHVLLVLRTMLAILATIYPLIRGIISPSPPTPSMWLCSGLPSWARTPCHGWLHNWWGPVQN